MSDREKWAVFANVVCDTAFRRGARVIIQHASWKRAQVYGLSISGRPIERYVPYKRLRSVRAAFVSRRFERAAWVTWPTKDDPELTRKVAWIRDASRDGEGDAT